MRLVIAAVAVMLSLCAAATAEEASYPCGPGDPVVEDGVRCDPNLWLFAVHLTAKDGVSHAMILASWTDMSLRPRMRRTIYLQIVRRAHHASTANGVRVANDACVYTTSIRAPLRHAIGGERNLSVCCEKNRRDGDARTTRAWWQRKRPVSAAAEADFCEIPYGFPLPSPAGRESSHDEIDDQAFRGLMATLRKLPWRSEWSNERATLEAVAASQTPAK